MLALAERLGMTMSELSERMTAQELMLWQAHDSLSAIEAEQRASKG